MKKVFLTVLTPVLLAVFVTTGCAPAANGETASSSESPSATESAAEASPGKPSSASESRPDSDAAEVMPAAGKANLPENVNSIVALAPSINETLVDLGLADKIKGIDANSAYIEGISKDAVQFDMANPDLERLLALEPDIVFVGSLSLYNQEEPYKPLTDAGISVVEVPTADSVAQIYEDIAFLADAAGAEERGEQIAAGLKAKIEEIQSIAAEIPEDERKSVYFEIAPAPDMYTTGGGTYLNEMIELIGADNCLGGERGWMPVSGEAVADADPDVILTNVSYTEDPIGEIKSREGWAGVKAVKEDRVYAIDANSSAQPNENITAALTQMAKAVYPEYYSSL